MVKNSNEELYIGITMTPAGRLYYHNTKQGAKFTKKQCKFKMVFLEEYSTLQEARHREIQIKKWRRDKKEMLIKRYSQKLFTKP